MSGRALLIAGPTAVGKSALAVAVARRVRGEIVNADSMQIYRDLKILTARPDEDETGGVPHHLYGVLDAGDPSSAARWHALATKAIQDIWARKRLPILVGGTGLYFQVALEGLAAVPEIPDEVREEVVRLEVSGGVAALRSALEEEDPEMAARLEAGDSQRQARALAVIRATGRSLADWQTKSEEGVLSEADRMGRIGKCVLGLPRAQLYARIDQRFEQMAESGALDEVRALVERGYSADLPLMRALGVPPLAAYIREGGDLAAAIERAKTETRRYAKRQLTWFRNRFADWARIDMARDDAVEQVIAIVERDQTEPAKA